MTNYHFHQIIYLEQQKQIWFFFLLSLALLQPKITSFPFLIRRRHHRILADVAASGGLRLADVAASGGLRLAVEPSVHRPIWYCHPTDRLAPSLDDHQVLDELTKFSS